MISNWLTQPCSGYPNISTARFPYRPSTGIGKIGGLVERDVAQMVEQAKCRRDLALRRLWLRPATLTPTPSRLGRYLRERLPKGYLVLDNDLQWLDLCDGFSGEELTNETTVKATEAACEVYPHRPVRLADRRGNLRQNVQAAVTLGRSGSIPE